MEFSDILNFLISLIVICNPLACLPVLLALSEGRSLEEKKRTGVVAAFAVCIIFLVIIWVGKPLLNFLAIRIPAFQVAGSVILFLLALSMLNARTSRIKHAAEDHEEVMQKESIAIVPLAMPLMAGPGAISLILVTTGNFPSMTDHFYLSFIALFVGGLMGIILYFSTNLERVLGVTGINVINRFAGLVLAAMSVEIFARGITGLFPFLTK
ncbi:MAG: NAAT family transporter [Chlamydiae bacterium]|nr:NAAT family transporter [Chlamydiota bacterium]